MKNGPGYKNDKMKPTKNYKLSKKYYQKENYLLPE